MHQSLVAILLALASWLYVGFAASSTGDYWEAESRMRTDAAYANSLATFNSRTQSTDTPMPDAALCRQHLANLNNGGAATGSLSERSLSPWRYIKNFDSRRAEPYRYVIDTACVCRGCFVPKEGDTEKFVYTESLMSVPIKINRTLGGHATTNGVPQEVTAHDGCQCEFPDYNNSNHVYTISSDPIL